jgi:hypothetical protein
MHIRWLSPLHILWSRRIKRYRKCSCYLIHGVICSVSASKLQLPQQIIRNGYFIIHTPNAASIRNQFYLAGSGVPEVYRMIPSSACKHAGGWICKTTQHLCIHQRCTFCKPPWQTWQSKQFTHQPRTCRGTSRSRTPARPRSPGGLHHRNLQLNLSK